jgi:hypothetical protein
MALSENGGSSNGQFFMVNKMVVLSVVGNNSGASLRMSHLNLSQKTANGSGGWAESWSDHG